ncbi:MAG: glycosyltransferase family 61 protein [Aeromicrobium sp.]
MSRLPSALQPAWPLVKRLHRLATRVMGAVVRLSSARLGERALPRRATERSRDTASLEPDVVRIHPGGGPEHLDRTLPAGDPEGHWIFAEARQFEVPARFTVEIDGGTVVGDYGANLTPARTLDYETSEYFGISGWREHPIFLRPALPRVEHVDGTLVSLAARGGSANYYHFLLDVLPRWGILEESMPGLVPDHLYVPRSASYQQELLALAGLDVHDLVATEKHRAVSADHLLVPSMPNPEEMAPSWTVQWVRERLAPDRTDGKPRLLYVTRGSGRHTRRLVDEDRLWPRLEGRGFVRIDPGSLSVRDQIDHFAAADVVVGLHGAALTNLVFAKAGARVLEIFAPGYVKHCYWAICAGIPGVRYQYLIGTDAGGRDARRTMNGIQDDIVVDPATLDAAVDRLLDS